MKASILLCLLTLGAASVHANPVTEVQNHYRDQGAGPFLFERGEKLWQSRPYQGRQCADCHGRDLKQPGQHQRTRKPIDPMAPSVTASRFTDLNKVEKWFKRNCKWTWDRECTAQEKGDLLEYLRRL